MTTTKEERIKRLEDLGLLAPNCEACKPVYESEDGLSPMMPAHKASDKCQSGKHPHCTCDVCF